MDHASLHLIIFLFTMCVRTSYASDVLRNPDFEIPPVNVSTNSSNSQFLLLTRENPIPGWTFNGTVYYVTSAGGNLSLGGNGNALQLAENGRINQTIRGIRTSAWKDYVLTFVLGGLNENCDGAAVNVSVHGKSFPYRSMVFTLQRNLSRSMWESNAFYVGGLGQGESINLEIRSVRVHSNCWPIVDSFTVKINDLPFWSEDNMMANGGFEIGPAFTKNSSDGVLLYYDPDGTRPGSPIQQWEILGTVKYINSTHYKVPKGKAAVQLLPGILSSSGVQSSFISHKESTYTLNFTMGDANDSCVGDLMVYLRIGRDTQNFTMRSIGTGSVLRHSVTFRGEDSDSSILSTPIVFYSSNENRRSDGSICGPVLDDVVLVRSGGHRIELHYGILIFSLFFACVLLKNSI